MFTSNTFLDKTFTNNNNNVSNTHLTQYMFCQSVRSAHVYLTHKKEVQVFILLVASVKKEAKTELKPSDSYLSTALARLY